MKRALSVFIIGCLPSLAACESKEGLGPGSERVVAPIVGGTDASPGEFPWQLSLQRQSGSTWSHSCGAVLLSSNYGLTAAHCVAGVDVSTLRVIAGLYARSEATGTQTVGVASCTVHEGYNTGPARYSNDIAIINFASSIVIGGNIQPATLPADNSNTYMGLTSVMSGWGRTSSSNILPDILQKASIEVIGTAECNTLLDSIADAAISDNQICVLDRANNAGACGGDGGNPLNAPDGVTRVAGIASWGISSGGSCLQSYPTVYTRTSAYLDWIAANTP